MRYPAVTVFLLITAPAVHAQAGDRARTYELTGGWWFDGTSFVRKHLYVIDGVFRDARPAMVDSVLDLGDAHIVPPFADAHTHLFSNPATVAAESRHYLDRGIFYALSLTGSARGQHASAGQVNTPTSVDVGYAAAITATLGHPILSAEVTANHIPWDSLRAYWPRLLQSHAAEGDVYFLIDSLPDLERQWPRIRATRPDLIKIFLLYSEEYAERRRSTTTINDRGLDPSLVPAIVARAHRDGLRVAAHVETAADFRVAARAGVDFVAHLPGFEPKPGEAAERYELTDTDAALAARNGTAVVPTAWLARRLAAPQPWAPAGSVGDTAQLARAQRIQRHSLERLMRHGVRIAIGSDLFEDAASEVGYLDSLDVFDNRSLLVMWSGVTPLLAFPTRKIGTLATGYEASFLALACNPIDTLSCTARIRLRFKQGVLLP